MLLEPLEGGRVEGLATGISRSENWKCELGVAVLAGVEAISWEELGKIGSWDVSGAAMKLGMVEFPMAVSLIRSANTFNSLSIWKFWCL